MLAVVGVRGESEHLNRVFDRSAVPMVMADDQRRHVAVNLAARLTLRLSMGELDRHRIDDLTPVEGLPTLEAAWTRLLETGSAAGRHQMAGLDGSRLEVRYWAVSDVRPRLHLIAFTPASWSERELRPGGQGAAAEPAQPLTSREREVLQLAAEGLSGPGIADTLVISHATVRAHFRNIYEKLGVGERPAAVATALRLGLIA